MAIDRPTRRALWVTATAPSYDREGGGHIRQAYLLEALCERFETHLLLAGNLEDELVGARLASVRQVPAPVSHDRPQRLRRRARDLRRALVERQPAEVAEHRPIRKVLGPLLAEAPQADLVCVEYVGLAPLLVADRSNFWTLTLHNLTSAMARQAAAIAPGRRQRLMLAAEERHSRRVERWAVGAYDMVVAVSEDDARQLPPGVIVVPNGVDTERFQPCRLGPGLRVVFTGALYTLPNVDGIRWFCREVWPRVRHRAPDSALDIVGARPLPEVLALGDIDGVTVHADVPSVVPFLERSRVSVVPLRIGTGSRIKALEAMACARPVVATDIGIQGLAVERGRHVLVADDAAAFADAVVQCLLDADLAGRLGRQGRALVESRYGWRRIGREHASRLCDSLDARAARARA